MKYIVLKPYTDHFHLMDVHVSQRQGKKQLEIFAEVNSFSAALRQRELAIAELCYAEDPDKVIIVREVDWRTKEVRSE